jgi:hypothetical protein
VELRLLFDHCLSCLLAMIGSFFTICGWECQQRTYVLLLTPPTLIAARRAGLGDGEPQEGHEMVRAGPQCMPRTFVPIAYGVAWKTVPLIIVTTACNQKSLRACLELSCHTVNPYSVQISMVISPAHSGKDYLPVTCRDEERFGLEYDLDVYNIVAVSDFNMGGARPCLALL